MGKILIPTAHPATFRTRRSTNDPNYETDLKNSLVDLFDYALTKRNYELKHKSNRNRSRITNQNLAISNRSIADMMNQFLKNSEIQENYSYPNDLLFLRRFTEGYLKNNIKPTTLYAAFKSLKDAAFKKRNPSITFAALSEDLKNLGYDVNEKILMKKYETMIGFFESYRKRTKK